MVTEKHKNVNNQTMKAHPKAAIIEPFLRLNNVV